MEEKAPPPPDFNEPQKVNVLDGLPAYLKDPKHFERIQREIYDMFSGACTTHSDVTEASVCVKCQKAYARRGDFMEKLGFKSPAQYRAWVKTHTYIRDRMKLR